MRTGPATTWRFLLAVFATIALTLAVLPGCDDDSGGGGSDDTNDMMMEVMEGVCDDASLNPGAMCEDDGDCGGGSCVFP